MASSPSVEAIRDAAKEVQRYRSEFENADPVSSISRFLDAFDGSDPEPDFSPACETLARSDLKAAVAELVQHNLDYISAGASLGTHRGDLVDTGLRATSSMYLLSKPAGQLILCDFDPYILKAADSAEGDRQWVEFPGRHLIIKVISGGPLELRRLSMNSVSDDSDFSKAMVLQPPRTIVASESSPAVVFHGQKDTYEVKRVHSLCTCLVLHVNSHRLPVGLRVDKASGKLIKTTPNDHSDASLVVAITELAARAPDRAVDVLARYTDYPAFFVRWHALRHLAAIAPATALDIIDRRFQVEANPSVVDALSRLRSHLQGNVRDATHC